MLVIGNGRMITQDASNPFLENGAVAMDGNTIVMVGGTEEVKKVYPDAEFVDAKGGVIMPAFINAHEHIYSSFARGLSINGYNPQGFLDILDGLWWTVDRHLTLEQTKLSAYATYIDSIKNGVTTVCDGMEKSRESVMENVNFIKHALADDSDMIAGMMGMHASFTISDETMALCNELKPEGVGYHIHVAEGIYDLHQCLKEHGKRIVDRLHDWNILGPKTLLGNCIYVNEHEMDLIKDTDTMVVHNPESNMGNACGCPPTMRMVQKGILTGLGTDGYTHDMMESWKVANVLHKHSLCDPNAAWGEVPQMLFEGNAKIANRYFKKQLGVLKEGAAADVIVIDYDPLTPMNESNINGHLMFGVNGSMVQTTVCNGKVLMKDREVLVCDEAKVMADCRQAAKELADDING